MKLSNPFARKPKHEEWQQRDELVTAELSVKKKEALIRELEARGGRGKWKEMSDDGKRSGINFSKVMAWLKSH